MDQTQARQVYERLFVAMPEIRVWLKGTPTPKETFDLWLDVLADVEFSDANTVVVDVVSGDEAPLPTFDRQRWPQFIRDKSLKLKSDRNIAAESDRLHDIGKQKPRNDAVKFIELLYEARDCNSERLEELVLLSKDLDLESPRYFCDICRDTGCVEVYKPEVIQQVNHDTVPKYGYATCNAACACKRGEGLRNGTNRYKPVPAYDPARFCSVGADAVAVIKRWIEYPPVSTVEVEQSF